MSEKNTGGSVCSRCDDPAVRKQGHQQLCAKHYRFGSMRTRAKRDNKLVPSHDELECMPGSDLNCPDCSRQMNWLAADGQSSVASLQHYRDGSMAIVCRSCNTRHAFMPDDSYRCMPKDHKYCAKCGMTKALDEFYIDDGRGGDIRRKSHCKPCSDKEVSAWKEKNRERYNEYQRRYRARRKAEGNHASSGS